MIKQAKCIGCWNEIYYDDAAGQWQHGDPLADHEAVMTRPRYVYVASSWRNGMQDVVVGYMHDQDIPLYDFKDDEMGGGFKWSELEGALTDPCAPADYLAAIEEPRAQAGYDADYAAMARADTFVLVLPCGRSAHLELGWAVGKGKRTAILLDGPLVTPELMYKMVDYITTSVSDLMVWLGATDVEYIDEEMARATTSVAESSVTSPWKPDATTVHGTEITRPL